MFVVVAFIPLTTAGHEEARNGTLARGRVRM